MRELLKQLAVTLKECDEPVLASQALVAAAGTESELVHYLTSNDLWGGAGSVADQAGRRTEERRRVEAALILLGREQMLRGVVNARTAGWLSTFEGWANNGI